MLKIRLQRVGRKNHAEFRVVVTESTKGPKSANYLEMLGAYNPHTNSVTVNGDRIKYWISKGAQPSDTVHNILVGQNVIEGKKRNVLPKKTAPAKAEEPAPAKEEVPEEVATPDEAPVAEPAPESAEAPAN